MSRLDTDQEKFIAKIRMYQDEVADSDLRDEECPLLVAQLEELQVLTSRLSENIRKLLKTMKDES